MAPFFLSVTKLCLIICSWNSQCLLLRPGGSAQHSRHRSTGAQSRRSFRSLQPTIFYKNCCDGSKADGTTRVDYLRLMILTAVPSYLASRPSTRRTSSTETSNPTTSSSDDRTLNRRMSFTWLILAWPSNIGTQRRSSTFHTENESHFPERPVT